VEGLVKDSRAIVSGSGKDLKESLRRVDATLYQLESAGRNLNEFSRTIRENPAVLINSRPPADVEGAPQ
jgi:phospholipid/cholesterol/gamma-HCH transport system substrate-binding protein